MSVVWLLAGGAIAAPWLLEQATTRTAPGAGNLPVPVRISLAQRAAARAVSRTVLGVPYTAAGKDIEQRLDFHWWRVLAEMQKRRGKLPTTAGGSATVTRFARLTPADAGELAEAFLGAVRAGVYVSASEGRYAVWGISYATSQFGTLDRLAIDAMVDEGVTAIADVRARVGLVASAAKFPFSALAKGVAAVVDARPNWVERIGVWTDERARAFQHAMVALLGEADRIGWSVIGNAITDDPIGVGDALAQSGAWIGEQLAEVTGVVVGGVARFAGGAVAAALVSAPGLVVLGVGGYLILRRIT